MKRKILFATLVACAGLFFSSCQDEEEFKISDDTMLGSEKSDYEVYANSSFSYYDPIIEGKDGTKYKMKTYGTNYFKFGITAK